MISTVYIISIVVIYSYTDLLVVILSFAALFVDFCLSEVYNISFYMLYQNWGVFINLHTPPWVNFRYTCIVIVCYCLGLDKCGGCTASVLRRDCKGCGEVKDDCGVCNKPNSTAWNGKDHLLEWSGSSPGMVRIISWIGKDHLLDR